ncbi:MAG: cobalamin-independent methionine synthase II family protein [Chloroflexi bacterium]|nr:cobalamin-independent methionine synthase II family protein [Chloroflexota bacterium]
MQRSTQRILTTHCGSLPRPQQLMELLAARDLDQPFDQHQLAQQIAGSVNDIVQRQLACGLDVVNDGEHSKSSFSSYVGQRLGGMTPSDAPFGHSGETRDTREFPGAYAEMKVMCAARPSNVNRPGGTGGARRAYVCTGPIRYIGQDRVHEDIANLHNALEGQSAAEAFVTALSPSNVALYHRNEFYATEEEYLYALADAMHVEYQAIVDAGFILQIDDPRLATHYDRHPEASLEDCRRVIALWVEVINHALRGIPEDRVRFHTCYSTNVAPRVHDMELRHFVDLMLQIQAGAYSFEASNPRHEHEWQVWETVQLPDDKVLVPGVVSHCITLVEHPDLVAQRIARFAAVVGRERVIASNDCGFATAGAGDEVHPDVAWAKLEALTEGARRASAHLW